MKKSYESFKFLDHYRRAASDLKSSDSKSFVWNLVYQDLMFSLQHLLLQIANDLNMEADGRWSLTYLRNQIHDKKILPPGLAMSLDVVLMHRNMLVHTRAPYDLKASDLFQDLNTIEVLILWYLTDSKFGPHIEWADAENLLNEEAIQKGKSIFISYASEDENRAAKIFDALIKRGHIPWMDKKNLVAGQDWNSKIRKAIEQSQFFVALLSKRSVSKRGFVQKELRFALDVLGEIPPGQIYFIPVRLENCDVPDIIRNLHWIDIGSNNDYKDLFRAIEYK